jgi:hypothetical protein
MELTELLTNLTNNMTDPVFAAIEQHKAAEAEFGKACSSDPRDEVLDPLLDVTNNKLSALLSTTPTTKAGCVALLRYIESLADVADGLPFAEWQENIAGPGATLFGRIADTLEAA